MTHQINAEMYWTINIDPKIEVKKKGETFFFKGLLAGYKLEYGKRIREIKMKHDKEKEEKERRIEVRKMVEEAVEEKLNK